MSSDDFAALDALTTAELRERAFDKADHAHDVAFFWDLVKHLRGSEEIASAVR